MLIFSCIFADDSYKEFGVIHLGNGDIYQRGYLEVSDSVFTTIMDVSDSIDFTESSEHISPLFSDLNFYTTSHITELDRVMLSRGIGKYLLNRDGQIYIHSLGQTQPDTLIAFAISPDSLSDGEFHQFYNRFEDNLTVLSTSYGKEDSLVLPWKDMIPESLFNKLINGDIKFWLSVTKAYRYKLICELMEQFDYHFIISTRAENLLNKPVKNALAIIDYQYASPFMDGDLVDSAQENLLDYNLEVIIRFPKFRSFWESIRFFNAESRSGITGNQIIQFYSLVPNQFYQNYLPVNILEEETSASYIIFSAEPFSYRSLINKIVIQGQVVYEK